MKTQNPLIPDTFKSRFKEWQCRTFGCITTGSYYGMPQAWCRRCGHVNEYIAADWVKEWHIPDL